MKATLPLTWRLTLLFVLAASTVLIGLGMVIAAAVERHFQEQDMEVLAGKMALTRHTLEMLSTVDDLPHVALMLDNALVGHHGLELLVLTPRREVLYATAGAGFTPQRVIDSARLQPNRPTTWTLGQQTYRGIATELPTGVSALSPLTVAVATDIAHHQAFMRDFQRTLWGFVAVAAALTGLLGWVAARRGLAPLRAMREQAQVVTAQQLSRRLAVTAVPAELAELAHSLNDMLARLEEAFARLSSFSSDIAHELRTPVSNLMTQTQVALTRARSADEYREVLASNAEEYERLARMIGDMLFLAQADHGLVVPNREPVDLALQVRELFDFFDALAEEKGLRLTLTGGGQVSGDKLMLRRALANLISNAIRHTPAGGTIRIGIESDGEGTQLTVENSGEPIPQEQASRIFDRFYRGDPSRHDGGEGAGLGLAITRSIIRAHGGEISVRSGTEGVCFELRMA